MIDMLNLAPGEVVSVDTQANIVSLANFCESLEVRDNDGNIVVVLNWGESYTLGYNKGVFKIRNVGENEGRVCIFRQFIL